MCYISHIALVTQYEYPQVNLLCNIISPVTGKKKCFLECMVFTACPVHYCLEFGSVSLWVEVRGLEGGAE